MARLRTVKPGFFTNEELADCGPFAMLLFEGLWTLADRDGRLEDRPRRIKAEVFPYFDEDVDALLTVLDRAGFVIRYEVEGKRFIQVVNFLKHQSPHVKEAVSTIPEPGESTAESPSKSDEHQTSTVLAPDKNSCSTPSIGEWDACLVIGSGGVGETEPAAPDAASGSTTRRPKESKRKTRYPEGFTLADSTVSWMAEHFPGIKPEVVTRQLEAFKNHHQANGTLMVDWQAGWRTWLGKAETYGHLSRYSTGCNSPPEPRMTDAEKLAAGIDPLLNVPLSSWGDNSNARAT